MLRRTATHTALIFSLVSCVSLYAQETAVSVREILRKADSLLVLRKASAAGNLYERALALDERSLPALIGSGRVALLERSWSKAVSAFEQASALNANSLEARYYLGCAYAERGRSRYLIERLLGFFARSSFDKAKEQLDWVIARDSLCRDALFQLAIVYYFQHEYRTALPFAFKQVELKPELRNGQSGVQKIYREAISYWSTSPQEERVSIPENDFDRFFHAERLRRAGRLEEADQCLHELQQKPGVVRPQLILQSMARIKAKQKKEEEVEGLITESIGSVRTLADADLVFEDIKYLISDQELEQFDALKTASDARQFFTTFWAKRNPYPAQRTNARIAQHYERLAYAEQYFEQFGRKTFAAETIPVDFPAAYFLNEEFNDKGIIYLRHGEPGRRLITGGRPTGGPIDSNESWQYFETPDYKEMLFDFYVPEGGHITEWRLIPVLPDPDMWEEREAYSHKYMRLMHAAGGMVSADLARSTDEGKQQIETGITTDRFSFADTVRYFESPISVACFRGSRGRTQVDIGYVVSPAEIAKLFPDTVRTFEVEAQCSMYTTAWKRVASSNKQHNYARAKGIGDLTIEQFSTTVAPDSYFVAWQAKPLHANMIFNKEAHVLAPDFSGTLLNVSDIELAYTIEPAKAGAGFIKGSLSVVPNPVGKCPLDHPLYLYFEVYNLTKDASGRTSYTIEYKLASVKINKSLLAGIFGSRRKTSVTVPSVRTGQEPWSQEHIALDVSELEPGTYRVQVTLKDNVAGTSASRSVPVEIYEKE
jgi:hypothetical protein